MSSQFPTDIPTYDPFSTPITLQAFAHTSRHRQMEEDIAAIATKVGKDGSADTDSHDYLIAMAFSDITASAATINSRIDDVLDGSEAFTTPAIPDFTNANHTHEDAANGGTLDGSALPSTDGLLKNVYFYTADDTWTKPAGLKFVIVRCMGGGGGGGGVGTTSGTGTAAGGGQGELSVKKIAAGTLGGTETVDVGAGGAGGSGNNAGSTGSTTSFGAHCTAIGGSGGSPSAGNTTSRPPGAGGSGGTADFAVRGAPGQPSTPGTSGGGGGQGGGVASSSGGTGAAGVRGGGGAGGLDTGTTSRTGGAGGDGYVIVEEYF